MISHSWKGKNQNDINEHQWKIGYIAGIKIRIEESWFLYIVEFLLKCISNFCLFNIITDRYITNTSNLEITMLWHISFFQPLASLWHTYVILMRYQNDNVLSLRVKWTKIVAFWNKISRLLVTFRFLTTSGTYKQTICQKSMPFRWQHWVCLKQPVLSTKSIFRL